VLYLCVCMCVFVHVWLIASFQCDAQYQNVIIQILGPKSSLREHPLFLLSKRPGRAYPTCGVSFQCCFESLKYKLVGLQQENTLGSIVIFDLRIRPEIIFYTFGLCHVPKELYPPRDSFSQSIVFQITNYSKLPTIPAFGESSQSLSFSVLRIN